jgi:hypothetical protein
MHYWKHEEEYPSTWYSNHTRNQARCHHYASS